MMNIKIRNILLKHANIQNPKKHEAIFQVNIKCFTQLPSPRCEYQYDKKYVFWYKLQARKQYHLKVTQFIGPWIQAS